MIMLTPVSHAQPLTGTVDFQFLKFKNEKEVQAVSIQRYPKPQDQNSGKGGGRGKGGGKSRADSPTQKMTVLKAIVTLEDWKEATELYSRTHEHNPLQGEEVDGDMESPTLKKKQYMLYQRRLLRLCAWTIPQTTRRPPSCLKLCPPYCCADEVGLNSHPSRVESNDPQGAAKRKAKEISSEAAARAEAAAAEEVSSARHLSAPFLLHTLHCLSPPPCPYFFDRRPARRR